MDWTTLIVGLATALCALLGSYLAHNKTTAVLEEKIKQLEKKMDKHNNLVERMVTCENKIDAAHNRMDAMRESMHKAEDDIRELMREDDCK